MVARLFNFRDLDLEVKAASVFGITSLVLSLIIGIASGNNLGNALLTSLILTLVFSGLGYGIIIVLRNFVPEFLEVFEIFRSGRVVDHSGDTVNIDSDITADAGGVERGSDTLDDESEESVSKAGDTVDFQPLDAQEMKRYSSGNNVSEEKLGKHIVVDQKKMTYEPKIVAEAIRTMMKRDND